MRQQLFTYSLTPVWVCGHTIVAMEATWRCLTDLSLIKLDSDDLLGKLLMSL